MNDYHVSLVVKNGILMGLMQERGIKSLSELSRLIGATPPDVIDLANFKKSPRKISRGGWTTTAIKIADFFFKLPEDIFPDHLLHVFPTNKVERYANQAALFSGKDQAQLEALNQAEKRQMLIALTSLANLTKNEQQTIKMRVLLENTFDEIAKKLRLTKERIRQIESKAFRKLRDAAAALKRKGATYEME